VLSFDFCSEEVKPSEIHTKMLAQCGEKYITQRKVYQQAESFLSGGTSVADENRSGRPNTSLMAGNVERVNAFGSRGHTDYYH
jgi:hypothetical protein